MPGIDQQIRARVQGNLGQLPNPQAQDTVLNGGRLRVQYQSNATRWCGLAKVAAVAFFPVGIVAALKGSYTRRLAICNGVGQPHIDSGVSRTDWKMLLRVHRDRPTDLAPTKEAHLRSVAIKLIGISGQDSGLKSLWQSPETRTVDLLELAVACVADQTGEYRKTVFSALRDDVKASFQPARSEQFEAMRTDFQNQPQAVREQWVVGVPQRAPAEGLKLGELLDTKKTEHLQKQFNIRPEHFDQVRPLIGRLMQMPAGTPDEQASWLGQTLAAHPEGARVLLRLPELLALGAFDGFGPLKELVEKDQPLMVALQDLLGLKLDLPGAGAGGKVKYLLAAGVSNIKVNNELKALGHRPLDPAKVQAFAQRVGGFATDYDFSTFAGYLDGMTDELPPEMGQFLKEVMQNYFALQTPADKKLMLASLYEHGNSTEPMDQLVALLKGAGPFMQKMMQSMGADAKDPSVKAAMNQLKENLNPLDAEERRVLLHQALGSLVKDGSQVSAIKVLSSASVAETVAVTLTSPPGPDGAAGVSRELIVKLRRPGVVERAGREREIFDTIAGQRAARAGAQGNDAIARSMSSIADQIESELDLRLEAKEIEQARAYEQRSGLRRGGLRVMHLAEGVPSRADFLILEKIPGQSVKAVIKTLEEVATAPAQPLEVLAKARDRAQDLCERLLQLNNVWNRELFHHSGFYHGDLHAGNLMFADGAEGRPSELGMIDFGNAATLSKNQQINLMRLNAASDAGHPQLAIDALRALLPPHAQLRLDQVRPILVLEAKSLMVKEEFGTLHLDVTSELISAATRLGIEIPGLVTQVGRSRGMLQATWTQAQIALAALTDKLGPPGTQPVYGVDAFGTSTVKAIMGSRIELARQVGLDFSVRVTRHVDRQAMFDEFQDHDAFVAAKKAYEDASEARSALESELQGNLTAHRMAIFALIHSAFAGSDPLDDAQWDQWVGQLADPGLRTPEDLAQFKAFCMQADAPTQLSECERFRPWLQALNPDFLAMLDDWQSTEVALAKLPSEDPAGKVPHLLGRVLDAERSKLLQALNAGAPRVAEDRREAVQQVVQGDQASRDPSFVMVWQEDLANRLSHHVASNQPLPVA